MSTNPSPAGGERPSQLIDLALQGGGSHGAFTWGVLDRLLEDSGLTIEAVSGTSAGAMNAAVMADGHARAGNPGARRALEAFWRKVSAGRARSARCSAARSMCCSAAGRSITSPAYLAFDMMARVFSPYDLAFGAPNPLTKVLSESIDFARPCRRADQAFHHGDERPNRAAARVPQRRAVARRAAGLGLPAGHVPGRRDRRRGLLGRRLFRQSDHHPAHPGMRVGRHDPGRHQSGGTPRHPAVRRATS